MKMLFMQAKSHVHPSRKSTTNVKLFNTIL